MNMLRTTIGDIIKTNKITQPLYKKYKTKKGTSSFKIDSIPTPIPCCVTNGDLRINLVLPTLRSTRVFAGITTALSFFRKLIEDYNCDARIVIMGEEKYHKNLTYAVEGFVNDRNSRRSLFFLKDDANIDVRKNDVFIFTYWKSAYAFIPVIVWQKKKYSLNNRLGMYLIQDYEPGFDAWSTKYALAESTYSSNPDLIFAIYNSRELFNYFKQQGYSFNKEMYFKPVLNSKLAEILIKNRNKSINRKKQIIIYGRPSDERNAFEIIRYALKIWSRDYPQAKDWRIVSLGDWFETIHLSNNDIEACGKVSLTEYAEYMLTSYAGISLMVSPHPSYPPLEMSTFGIKTITNQFANKDLSSFNKNIVSLRDYTPGNIARVLSAICDNYGKAGSEIVLDKDYLDVHSFNLMVKNAEEILNGILSDN